MRTLSLRLLVGAVLVGALPTAANAATTTFGPTVYLQTGDTPAGFVCTICSDDLHIEDFEDNMLDPFLTVSPGEILPPNGESGIKGITDSVDGDDGSVDGNGNAGYSWYAENKTSITVTFGSSVTSAGLVFTDGDNRSANISLEAFDMNGVSLGIINAGDLADDVFTGETAEDRFLGFRNEAGKIASITLVMDAGVGIEIDHIQWQNCQCIPEPASLGMGLVGVLGLAGLRRRRRN